MDVFLWWWGTGLAGAILCALFGLLPRGEEAFFAGLLLVASGYLGAALSAVLVLRRLGRFTSDDEPA